MGAAAPLFVAQAALSAYDTYNQYTAERLRGKFEQDQANIGARFSRLQAEDTSLRGDIAAGESRRRTAQVRGAQVAAYASQGIDVRSGIASAIQAETEAIGANEADTIKNNAWRQAWGLRTQADQFEATGRMAKLQSKARQRSTLLTGGMNLASIGANAAYYRGSQQETYATVGGRRTRVAPPNYYRGRT